MALCSGCGTENGDGARFCNECGTRLGPPPGACEACGHANAPSARFCSECGTSLASGSTREPPAAPLPATAPEVRKMVTIVFSDLKGSTNLGERLDSEALREVIGRYFDAMSAELVRHGGMIEKFIGDAIMAVFGLPQLHEDDALRAVRAALGMQSALAVLNEELDRLYGVRLVNRTGVNTGQVVAGDPTTGQRLVTGDVVNVAARLEQAAGESEVLIGELTHRLVRDAVVVEPVEPLELKGKSERVPAYRLLELCEVVAEEPIRNTPMVGRDAELSLLFDAFGDAMQAGRCRLVSVMGEAGVGKSKLTAAFLRGVADEATVLVGRCLPYGDGITFWPLSDATRSAAGIVNDDDASAALAKLGALVGPEHADVAARVAAAIGLSREPFTVDELFWGARRLFELLATSRPLVVLFDDVHWAERTFLDLIGYLQEEVRAPMLLLCPSRPELLDARPDFGTGAGSARIVLDRLTTDESSLVVDNLLGRTDLDDAVRARIVASADGNPLFVEQLLSMLIDDGVLRFDGNRWRAEGSLEALTVPPTIQALLASRLDALALGERAVIEPASVVGYFFPQPAVESLVGDAIRPAVPTTLDALTQKQLVIPAHDEGDGFRFQHILVRDTAYDGILKRQRALLHERFVRWADGVNRDRAIEFEEILGYHLEQAWRYLSELGPLDARGLGIGADGAARLTSAGRRAFERGDASAAANLLGRAVALLPLDDAGRLDVLSDYGEALLQVGRFDDARAALDAGIAAAEESGRPSAAWKMRLVGLLVDLRLGGQEGWSARVEHDVAAAVVVFEADGDQAGLAWAWRLLAWLHGSMCRFGEAAEAAERGLRHARLAGDPRQERRAATAYAAAAVFGPTPVAEALERCEQIVATVAGDRHSQGLLHALLGSLLAMDGSIEAARSSAALGITMLQELGLENEVARARLEGWRVEMAAGDLEAAESMLRVAYDALRDLGERWLLPTVAGLLAQTLLALGRPEETPALAELVEGMTADDDLETKALSLCLRGTLLAHDGEVDAGVARIREAIEVLAGTDAVLFRAGSLRDLAGVLRRAGREGEARAALEEALAIAEAKGDRSTTAAIRRGLDGPGGA